jgi:hypothetical protein
MAARRRCKRPACGAPQFLCVMGDDFADCPYFLAADTTKESTGTTEGQPFPWSGLALGEEDLATIAALGRTRIVALVGLHDSGKTTALAAAMIDRRRGSCASGVFAGSLTLLGWQQIARHLEWPPRGSGGFPPHTTSADGRVPSLLHFALRQADEEISHLLYADVPGEWFRDWSFDEDSSKGASWLAEHADSFVLFADSAALAGEDRGAARGDYEALALRVASVAEGRPVVPIRTKADIAVPDEVLSQVEALNERRFSAPTVAVSIYDNAGDPITLPVDAGTAAALRARPFRLADSSPVDDPLLALGTQMPWP